MTRIERTIKGNRDRLLPIVASAFAELGYRRATTAELASRCGVRENVLYRVWSNKKDMFLAAIDYVSLRSLETWRQLLSRNCKGSSAQRVLEYEAVHHGEFGMYRIVFAGLNETDDPNIREALRQMYLRFHRFIMDQIGGESVVKDVNVDLVAWAFVGIGTISNISRELGLMADTRRQMLFKQMGKMLIGSDA